MSESSIQLHSNSSSPIDDQPPLPPPDFKSTARIDQSPKIKINKISTKMSSGGRSGGGRHPVYRGIRSRSGKWVSEIREPRKTTRIWLGTYRSPEMAAAAYDVAAAALKGSDVALNFPGHVGLFPAPSSPSPSDIRRAAAGAAEMMRRAEEETAAAEEERQEDRTADNCDDESLMNGEDRLEFVDEEALFHMPNLLMDMAKGMLVSPPRIESPPSDEPSNGSDCGKLWSYF
ncbi:ethylene-responsive transcription factor ERF027-like [Andrographis paniculata]|uniref:ethylene-responsive transcription factor ERF027-like n=1 Tax=Andrographis paniculata TaxID=175694 RepID=UPI0021E8A965|nr:ethylene-responsive transcription factor ERF027-like [Andrographis paniculata]